MAYGIGSIMVATLYKPFDLSGIVFSIIIANALYCLIMMSCIIKKLKMTFWPIFIRFIQNLSIAILSGIMGLLVSQWLSGMVINNWFCYAFINIIIPASVITSIYLLLAKWLKFEETNVLLNILVKKFKRL